LVNAVAPGFTKTPDWNDLTHAAEARLSKKIPLLGRFITPEEIAETIFLVHKLPVSVGNEIIADGGTTFMSV
jgi:NAD(P)-dependent dehydrogenase (short-subunit alcohol dehydrogenase family)